MSLNEKYIKIGELDESGNWNLNKLEDSKKL